MPEKASNSPQELFQLPIIFIESGVIIDATQKTHNKGRYYGFIAMDKRPKEDGIDIGLNDLTEEVQESIREFSEKGLARCLREKGFVVTTLEK